MEREGKGLKYVMNYELHPKGHGWHIHGVFNRYINLRGGGLQQLRRYGFKMINIKKVTTLGVSLYLSKHCLKAYRGVRKSLNSGDVAKRLRLVNTSRGLPKLSDYRWQSAYIESVASVMRNRVFRDRFKGMDLRRLRAYAEVSVLWGVHPWRLFSEYREFKGFPLSLRDLGLDCSDV